MLSLRSEFLNCFSFYRLRELALLNGTLRESDGPRCNNCGSTAHRNWQCPDKPNITNNVTCNTCGGIGHVSRDCKERPTSASSASASSKIDEEYQSLMAELGQGKPPPKNSGNSFSSSSGGQGFSIASHQSSAPRAIAMAPAPPPPAPSSNVPAGHQALLPTPGGNGVQPQSTSASSGWGHESAQPAQQPYWSQAAANYGTSSSTSGYDPSSYASMYSANQQSSASWMQSMWGQSMSATAPSGVAPPPPPVPSSPSANAANPWAAYMTAGVPAPPPPPPALSSLLTPPPPPPPM